MIVLEGCDGTGKSTLAVNLQESFGFDIGKRATKNRDLLYTVTRMDTWGAVGRELSGRDESPLIWDRLCISDFVYAPATGRECAFSGEEFDQFLGVLAVVQAPIIWCNPGWDAVLASESQDGRHEMPGVRENLRAIHDGYVKLMTQLLDKTDLNIVEYDYRDPRGYQIVADAIKRYQDFRNLRNVNRDLAVLENKETA